MAVTILDSGSTSSGVSLTKSVSSGTDRIMAAGYAEFLDSGASIVGGVSMSYGGQSLTLMREDESSFGSWDTYCGVFYLNDSSIAAASGTTLSVTGYGATNRGGLGALVFQNAEQTTPEGNSAHDESSGAQTGTATLTVNANNAAFGIAVAFGNGSGNPTISNNGGTDFTGQGTWDAYASTEGGIQSRVESTGASRSDAVTWSISSCTLGVTAVEYVAPLATGGGPLVGNSRLINNPLVGHGLAG